MLYYQSGRLGSSGPDIGSTWCSINDSGDNVSPDAIRLINMTTPSIVGIVEARRGRVDIHTEDEVMRSDGSL
ncbi:hypothetical protein CHU98_g5530 [Xylaria longipes]|nr:hypothetical protein CHU98_g5530 [Xylaria longipes]